ncbi:phage tail protein [Enterovibrio calviensis]|uniref:phage tail protein n=1 Tax=Enterovibrio calviensis TaxID=91359 RepID=UPI0037355BB9
MKTFHSFRAIPALFVVTLLVPASSLACAPDPYLSAVCFTANTFCPEQYREADGAILQTADYPALYSLLGNNYGGNGTTTFQLPDLRGRTPVGAGFSPPLEQKFGKETLSLTDTQLPSHRHNIDAESITVKSKAASGSLAVNNQTGTEAGAYLTTLGPPLFTSTKPNEDSWVSVDIPKAAGQFETVTKKMSEGSPVEISQPSSVLKACIGIDDRIYPLRY